MSQRLSEIDVDEISFVDRPANKKRFAIVKRADGERTMDLKELLKDVKLEDVVKHFGKDAVAKAIGKQAPDGGCPEGKVWDPEKGECVDRPAPASTDMSERGLLDKVLKAVAKALGVDPGDDDDDDEELSEAVRKRLEMAEQKVEALEKVRADEAKAAIRKRAEELKKLGYEIDPEKASEIEVAAVEKTHKTWAENLRKAGVTSAIGESRESDTPATAREEVDDVIRKHLGREPRSRRERALVLKELAESTPGLMTRLVKEERERRRRSA